MSEQTMCDPTEQTLYKEPHDDTPGTFTDRIYCCGKGPRKGIGISVGGSVYVRPLKDWHSLESRLAEVTQERDQLKAELISKMRIGIDAQIDRDTWKGLAEKARDTLKAIVACAEFNNHRNCVQEAKGVLALYEAERKP